MREEFIKFFLIYIFISLEFFSDLMYVYILLNNSIKLPFSEKFNSLKCKKRLFAQLRN